LHALNPFGADAGQSADENCRCLALMVLIFGRKPLLHRQ